MLTQYFFIALLTLFFLPVFAQENTQNNFTHGEWSALLKKHVVNLPGNHATQVNYAGVASEQNQLERYLAKTSQVSRVQFDHWTKEEQLAFLINAYNAWTVKFVLSDYKNIKSIKELGSVFQSPWKKVFIPLLGSMVSLDDIEHELIRGSNRYRDLRIHFALNCASIGCPALRSEAYDANQLSFQLEDQTHRFMSDRKRNYIENGDLKLSSIFKWYYEDFEKGWLGFYHFNDFLMRYSSDLGLTENQREALQNNQINIGYLNYNWNLNGAQP